MFKGLIDSINIFPQPVKGIPITSGRITSFGYQRMADSLLLCDDDISILDSVLLGYNAYCDKCILHGYIMQGHFLSGPIQLICSGDKIARNNLVFFFIW